MRQTMSAMLKQYWYPSAFRLQRQDFTREQLDVLEELIGLIQPTMEQESVAREGELSQMARFLADLGSGLWRIRRKTDGMKRMPKELKDAMFSLESTWNSMAEGGVEIVDHLGSVPSAEEARVVEMKEVDGLTSAGVIETLRPTILLRGAVVQMGEVVMGVPPAGEKRD